MYQKGKDDICNSTILNFQKYYKYSHRVFLNRSLKWQKVWKMPQKSKICKKIDEDKMISFLKYEIKAIKLI